MRIGYTKCTSRRACDGCRHKDICNAALEGGRYLKRVKIKKKREVMWWPDGFEIRISGDEFERLGGVWPKRCK